MGALLQRERNKMCAHIAWHKILRLLERKVNKKKRSALSIQQSAFSQETFCGTLARELMLQIELKNKKFRLSILRNERSAGISEFFFQPLIICLLAEC